jgi:hypothetical protein
LASLDRVALRSVADEKKELERTTHFRAWSTPEKPPSFRLGGFLAFLARRLIHRAG